MKVRFLLFIVVLSAAVFIYLYRVPESAPFITIVSKLIDRYELVSQGGVQFRHYSIEYKNTGNSVLRVSKIVTSCGCTTVAIPPPLPPNQRGQFMADVYIPNGVIDNKRVDIMIYSNAINEPISTARIVMHITQVISLPTEEVNFGDVLQNNVVERDFSVGYQTKGDVIESNARGSKEISWLINRKSSTIASNVKYSMFFGKLILAHPGTIGDHTEMIYFEHPDFNSSYYSVTCTWKVIPKLRLLPSQIILAGHMPVQAQCAVISPIRIASDLHIKCASKDISISIANDSHDNTQYLIIARCSSRVTQRTEINVTLETDDRCSYVLPVVLLPDQ